jgi:hypothetical protein
MHPPPLSFHHATRARLNKVPLDAVIMTRLHALKQQIAIGERSELTRADKYLQFAKNLVDAHYLDEKDGD